MNKGFTAQTRTAPQFLGLFFEVPFLALPLRRIHEKESSGAARTFGLAFERSAMLRGDFASLASAVPCTATARFRSSPATIPAPRHASLIAASRNLERNDTRRKRLSRVSFPFRAASHRKTIECSLFQSSIEVLRRPDSLQTACRQPDIGRYSQVGDFPLWHLARSLMGTSG